MTCDTARTLLLFYRPGNNSDLAAEDVAALEGHLVGCPACSSLVGTQTATDAAIGRAFRQVDVPGGLKARLHARAAADVGRAWRQTWMTRGVMTAWAAVAVLTGWGAYVAWRPPLDTVGLALSTEALMESPVPLVQDWLAAEGIPQPLPEDFEFQRVTFTGYAKVQGESVPVMEFRANGGFARVYLIRPRTFNVKDATETQSSLVTVRLYKDKPAPGWTVIIVHTGPGLQPFLRVPPPQG